MTPGEITIRETTPADSGTVFEVQRAGFGYDKEAELTAALLCDPSAEPVVSLLAFRGTEAVGHILFTRCRVENAGEPQPMLHILAPLAVVPPYQRQGIGGLLIAKGLQLLRERGTELVFVLGHKEYYPRHGFVPDAGKQGFQAPYPHTGRICGVLDGTGFVRAGNPGAERQNPVRRHPVPPRALARIKHAWNEKTD